MELIHQVPLLLLLLLQLHHANAYPCKCTFNGTTPVRTETNSKSHVVQLLGSGTCFHGLISNGWFIVTGHPDMNIQEDHLMPYGDCKLLDASEWLAEIPRTGSSHHSVVWMPCLVDRQLNVCFAASFKACARNSSLDGCPPMKIAERRFLLDHTNMCDFEANNLCSWQNVQQGDDFDWIRYRSSTPTDDTGPDFDNSLKNVQGNYMFIESSSPRVQNEKAWLMSPFIQSPGTHFQCFQFWYHMKGSSIGQLNVYQKQDSHLPGNLVWSLSEQQGPDWLFAQVPLDATVGFKLVVEATVGSGYEGDIAIDDFNLTEGFCSPLPMKASRTNLANKVNGQWTSWYPWAPCSVTCGLGDHYRLRTCTHPRPQNGGSYCDGEAEERDACLLGACFGSSPVVSSSTTSSPSGTSTDTSILLPTTTTGSSGTSKTTAGTTAAPHRTSQHFFGI
ncbi:hypothetical protein DPMN_095449 [Dreissena polymorpha]|uniref:MAM domain-containing protein n=1 Tax=Dreissena polymorpha TaxID=45954 RepID=A0A9D4R3K3_DREPO|nr:hypothetical protein DPMN_095449 [Dreissena polymorpha]